MEKWCEYVHFNWAFVKKYSRHSVIRAIVKALGNNLNRAVSVVLN